jgi:Tfp pilus assembly protein PilX
MSGSFDKELGMRARPLSDERGIALAVAVFALVVIGALVAGAFFAGRLEQQTGRNTLMAAEAAEAAEAGLNDAMAGQTAATLLAILPNSNPNAATALPDLALTSGRTASRSINRLTENVFLLRSVGRRTDASGGQIASRSIGQLIRLVQADIDVGAGLTAMGDVTLTGASEVSGLDEVPQLWAGVECPPLENVPGIKYNDGDVKFSGNGTVYGAPDTLTDNTLTTNKMKEDFDKLKTLATLILSANNPPATGPVHVGDPARCDKSVESNWGEPSIQTDPCSNYFPIIYHNGNLALQGGVGQGILLVEGDLTATGGMVFYGPVFVTGTLSTAGNKNQGAKFYGGVIAGNVSLDDVNKLSGQALVSYSSCAVKRALQNSSTPAALAERSWVQVYN